MKFLNNAWVVAQISDSHLFATPDTCHAGAPVYQNLLRVVRALEQQAKTQLDAIVVTGDLTQDHSLASYQLFARALVNSKLECPVFFIPGNHDDRALLQKELTGGIFRPEKSFCLGSWQILLLDSKGDTPAGFIDKVQLSRLAGEYRKRDFQFVFLHHHPLDVGYFIDRHGLKNQSEFWQAVAQNQYIKGIACGHVHNDLALSASKFGVDMSVHTCPATSLQFDKQADTVKDAGLGGGFRVLTFTNTGRWHSRAVFISR